MYDLRGLRDKKDFRWRSAGIAPAGPAWILADYELLFPYRIGEELPTKRPLCETWARMSHSDPNGPPDRRPIKVGEVWENPVTGERSVIQERPWDNPASRVTGELTALVGAHVMGEHRHPALVEQFTVLEGALSILRFGGRDGIRTHDLLIANEVNFKLRRDAAIT